MVILIALSIIFAGCGGGDDGDVGPSRRACAIHGGSDGVSAGWFVYVDAFGEEINQEGIRMDINGGDSAIYLSNNGLGGLKVTRCDEAQHIESSGVTGANGRCITNGIRDEWAWPKGFWVRSNMTVLKPDSPGTYGKFGYVTLASIQGGNQEVASSTASKTCGVAAMGSPMPTQEEMATMLVPEEMAMMEIEGMEYAAPMFDMVRTTGNYTQAEYDALTNPTENAPSNGIDYTCQLIQQRSNGSCKVMNSIMAVNLTDPNDYLKYSAPFMYSYIVKTAEAIQISGEVGSATVKTNSHPDGIQTILSWYGSNEDGQTHVFRTARFFPVSDELSMASETEVAIYDRWTDTDPNVWNEEMWVIAQRDDWFDRCVDPNVWPDPNFYPVPLDPNSLYDPTCECMHTFTSRIDTSHPDFMDIMIPERISTAQIIPMAPEGDHIRVAFNDDDLAAIVLAIEYWLSDNRIYDRNGDGVVNLHDYHHD